MNFRCGRRGARFLAAGLGFGIAAATAPPTTARTWQIHVDGSGDAPTVQAGIDSAALGDTVLVHPGVYNEQIIFRGRDIFVISDLGPSNTMLDGTGLGGRVVTFDGGESRSTELRGFVITGGQGGIFIHNSQPSIIGNVIINNGPVQNGGGIWCSANTLSPWFPLIQQNSILNNRSNNLAGGFGTLQSMVPEVLDNHIEGNEAGSGDGGGIYYRSLDDGAVIRGNTVINNRAGDHGGGIYCGPGTESITLELEISWNLVAANLAGGRGTTGNSGGGIWLWRTNAWIHHNTIVDNTGDGPNNAYGGGIVMEKPGTPVVEKNIIAFTQKGGGIWCGGGATPLIRNNLAWQNVGGDGVGTCPAWWQVDGNIVADPHFCGAMSGDYSVARNSPALTHIAGPLGAFHLPGCGPVSAEPTTWGRLKARYMTP